MDRVWYRLSMGRNSHWHLLKLVQCGRGKERELCLNLKLRKYWINSADRVPGLHGIKKQPCQKCFWLLIL